MNKHTIKIIIILIAVSALIAGYTPRVIKTDSFKSEFLSRINEVRQKGCKCGNLYMPPVPPLVWNDNLTDAAKDHARDMSKRKYFSHTSKDGRSIKDRIMAADYTYDGYKSFAIGENIAQGQESITEVSDGWFQSPGHCKNLMNPSFKEIGVAEYNRYWVQDFGGRIAFSEQEQKMIKSGKLIIKRRVEHQ
jgi:uncharacterized protein YkwD